METIEQAQNHDTMLASYRNASLRTMSPLEEQAHGILTSFAFKKFQEEFGRASQYLVIQNIDNEFIMQHYTRGNTQQHKVLWDNKIARCSCRQFEFCGILCRHILSVFSHNDCFEIPFEYLPSRWRREAFHDKEAFNALRNDDDVSLVREIPLDMVDEEDDNVSLVRDIPLDIVDEEDIIYCPPTSKTKGRRKQTRMKGGRELGKQRKSCGFCKLVGHNISTCPQKNDDDFPNHSQKKKKKVTSDDLGLNPIFCLKY